MKKISLISLFLLWLILFIASKFVFIWAHVPSGSMEPTISTSSFVFGNRLFSRDEIKRGDILIFYSDEEQKLLIKRVIGLPNDHILIQSGTVYINNQALQEDYVKETWNDFGEYLVPQDCYFFLGDNRNHSNDSRNWSNPYIPTKKLKAKYIHKGE